MGILTDYFAATPDEALACHEGPFLVAVKEGCRAALAGVTDEPIPALAQAWSQADEWFGADPDGLAAIIAMLHDVARAAGENGRTLYVRIVV